MSLPRSICDRKSSRNPVLEPTLRRCITGFENTTPDGDRGAFRVPGSRTFGEFREGGGRVISLIPTRRGVRWRGEKRWRVLGRVSRCCSVRSMSRKDGSRISDAPIHTKGERSAWGRSIDDRLHPPTGCEVQAPFSLGPISRHSVEQRQGGGSGPNTGTAKPGKKVKKFSDHMRKQVATRAARPDAAQQGSVPKIPGP